MKMTTHKGVRPSVAIMATIMCAGLYAIGSYSTAFIPSPWGFGQFRWAVVIPAFFAVIFGPLPAGIGAAMGTLIADSIKHGYLYPGSLFAAVPGNFIGFYLMGYIVRKKFTWGRFISASNLTLVTANFIVAFLYISVYKVLYLGQLADLSSGAFTFLVFGLTIWWFVTMLPFVLLVTPPLLRVAAVAFPSIVPEDVRSHSLKQELPKKTFSLAMLIPGLIMLSFGLASTYTNFGNLLTSNFGETTMALVQLMFYGSGVVLAILGLSILISRSILR